MENSSIDLSTLPACYSKKKTRKCSSCKCLKPMDQFLPIVINKKTVIPKTCQYCRSRRNSYYWNFESKKTKVDTAAHSQPHLTPMKVGYLENPSTIAQTPKVVAPVDPVPAPLPEYPLQRTSVKREMATPEQLPLDAFSLSAPMMGMDDDMNKCADELHSMSDYDQITKKAVNAVEMELPESMDVNDIIFELQRQTVQNMMDELVNISDILAASQLDAFSSAEAELPPMDDIDAFQLPIESVM